MYSVNSEILGYRQVGKAVDSESTMRWFESSYPSHENSAPQCGAFFIAIRAF